MRNLTLTILLLGTVFTSTSFAQEKKICRQEDGSIDATCGTMAAGSAGALASTIYSAKKYSKANSIEAQYTEHVFKASAGAAGDKASTVTKNFLQFTNGDKISIQYNLSPAENREYHIELMKEHAASARSSASYHQMMALTATKTESYTDSSGKMQTRTVPDEFARQMHVMSALQAEREAGEYDVKAAEARRGGPVPTYDLDKVIDVKSGTRDVATEFASERIDRGGKILTVDRLPVQHFNLVKSSVRKATAGIVGAAVGVGLVAEEAMAGAIAEKINNRDKGPKMRSYSESTAMSGAQ